MSTPVAIDVLVVPDGIHPGPDGTPHFRLSLSVTPRKPAGDGHDIDISQWPVEVRRRASHVRVLVGTLAANASSVTLRGEFSTSDPAGAASFTPDPASVWRTIFDYDGTGHAFTDLVALLDRPLDPVQQQQRDAAPLETFGTYPAADLAVVHNAIYGGHVAKALNGRLDQQMPRDAAVSTSAPVSAEPSLAWWRELGEQWLPPTVVAPPRTPGVLADPSDAPTRMASPASSALSEMIAAATIFRRDQRRTERSGAADPSEADQPAVQPLTSRLDAATGLAAAARHFSSIATAPAPRTAAPADVASDAAVDGRAALRNALERFAYLRGLMQFDDAGTASASRDAAADPPAPRTEEDDNREDRQSAARRKLNAILTHPTLAKYLGLIVDVTVPVADVLGKLDAAGQGRVTGVVAAELLGEDTRPVETNLSRYEWTAFTYRAEAALAPAYFGPAAGRADDPVIKDGVIDLSVMCSCTDTAGGRVPRFRVDTTDVSQSTSMLMQRAREILLADNQGQIVLDAQKGLPSVRSHGLVLFDREPPPPEPTIRADTLHVSYAEDLLLGYRIDVGVGSGNAWRDATRWRSLMCRDLAYDTKYVDPKFEQWRVRARDDGHVRHAREQRRVNTPTVAVNHSGTHEQVFTWTGESLGAPSLHGRGDDGSDPSRVGVRRDMDLAIDVTVDLPAETDHARHAAPLREGVDYILGARAFLVNGCGLELADAVKQYVALIGSPDAARWPALGCAPGRPFTFERRGEIAPPDVCLPWDDPLVNAVNPKSLPGETIETMVVRAGGIHAPTARRILLPARATFEMCEQAGVFDAPRHVNEHRPRGAFVGKTRLAYHEHTGALPMAMGGGAWEYARTVPDPAAGPTKSRGAVAVLGVGPHEDRSAEYYPDPLGRSVCARFLVDDKPAPDFAGGKHPVAFWDSEQEGGDAEPVVLELRRAERHEGASHAANGTRPPVGWFEESSGPEPLRATARLYRGSSAWLRCVRVALEPGESVDLELWSMHDVDRLQRTHWALANGLRLLESAEAPCLQTLRRPDDRASAIHAAICTAPLAGLHGVRSIRLVHAVPQPLDSPKPISLRPVVITVRPNTSSTSDAIPVSAAAHSWQDYARSHLDEPVNNWPSEPGGSVTFFIGDLSIHRASTAVVRAEARWDEYAATLVRQDPVSKRWSYEPTPNFARLFSFENIDSTAAYRDRPVSLLLGDADVRPDVDLPLRSLAYGFPDGKARRLTVGMIATSRFTNFYPPAGREVSVLGPGKYEKGFDHPEPVWVPATARPERPIVDKILPVFHWSEERTQGGRRIAFSRSASLRIHFARATWPSSGEGEALAVTFAAATFPGDDVLCAFEEDKRIKPFLASVTRWGSDPIHMSGPIETLIASRRFVPTPQTEFVPDLKLPFGSTPQVTKVSHPAGSGGVLGAGTEVTIDGQYVAPGNVTVIINNQVYPGRVPDGQTLKVTLTAPARLPLTVEVRNPELDVNVLAYPPAFDADSGRFYADVTIDPDPSYFPFVQLGLARYQRHAAGTLQLSPPTTQWAQVPPRRSGFVEFIDRQTVVLHLQGVGYEDPVDARGEPLVAPGHFEKPVLRVQLMRAARPSHVPRAANGGGIAWKPVVGDDGQQVPVIEQPAEVRRDAAHRLVDVQWIVRVPLPRPRSDVRYALFFEEVERMAADPEDPSRNVDERGELGGGITDRAPMFWHIVDLGH